MHLIDQIQDDADTICIDPEISHEITDQLRARQICFDSRAAATPAAQAAGKRVMIARPRSPSALGVLAMLYHLYRTTERGSFHHQDVRDAD